MASTDTNGTPDALTVFWRRLAVAVAAPVMLILLAQAVRMDRFMSAGDRFTQEEAIALERRIAKNEDTLEDLPPSDLILRVNVLESEVTKLRSQVEGIYLGR